MWYEYAVDELTPFGDSAPFDTWPDLSQTSSELDCGSNCIQGELVARTKTVNNIAENVSAYAMLSEL